MNNLRDLLANEPALVLGMVVAALNLMGAFGLALTDAQVAAIVGLVGAVLAFVGAMVTRSRVTPSSGGFTTAPRPAKDDFHRGRGQRRD